MNAVNTTSSHEFHVKNHLPRHHCHAEAHQSAYTETRKSTDHNFHKARERETDTRVYGVHAPHGPPKVYHEHQVRGVREYGQNDSPAAR